jgi:hypothetical protein
MFHEFDFTHMGLTTRQTMGSRKANCGSTLNLFHKQLLSTLVIIHVSIFTSCLSTFHHVD